MNDWVSVYSAVTVSQVYIFKAALEDAGIPTVIENEALQGAYGGVSFLSHPGSMAPKLMVPRSQEQEARRIIAEIESAPSPEITDDDSE